MIGGKLMRKFFISFATLALFVVAQALPAFMIPTPESYDVLAGDYTQVDLVSIEGEFAIRFVNGGGEWRGHSVDGETFNMTYAANPDPYWYLGFGDGEDGMLTLTEHFSDDSFGATSYEWQRRFTIEGELNNTPIFTDLIRVADMRLNIVSHDWFYDSSFYPQFNPAIPGAARINERLDTLYGVAQALISHEWYVDDAAEMRYPYESERATMIAGAADRFVSTFSVLALYTGGAHPNTHSETQLLYLADDGVETFELRDLFVADSGWLAQLGQFAQAALIEAGADWPGEEGAEEPFTEEELHRFMLTPGGMILRFDAYDVGPYVSGAYTVLVPYEFLMEFAHDDGAIHAFANGFPAALFTEPR